MKIVDFLRQDMIVPEIQERSKPDLLAELTRHLATVAGLDREQVLKVLLERERLASTAISEGVAIPHGKLNTVKRLTACVGRSRTGVNFESMDGRPTHIFFVLVAPEQSTGEHLKALARISRLFKDPEFRTRLMQAEGASGLYRVIADEDAKY